MSPDEARQFLQHQNWGMRFTVGGGEPYTVPVSFRFDGFYLYVATGPGRKARNVDENPAVCLTVADVQDGNKWKSVVVSGQAEWLDDAGAKLRALNVLRRDRIPGALLMLGGALALLAFFTGQGALDSVLERFPAGSPRIEAHTQWGAVGTWVLGGLALLRAMWRERLEGPYGWANLAAALVAAMVVIGITLDFTR